MEVIGYLKKTGMLYCRGKNPVTQWIGGWVDVRACMNFVKKRKLCSPWIRILALQSDA
jgi:hypothetical protein